MLVIEDESHRREMRATAAGTKFLDAKTPGSIGNKLGRQRQRSLRVNWATSDNRPNHTAKLLTA